jgi:protocatechuate 3,4-dioxygenase beta subunit
MTHRRNAPDRSVVVDPSYQFASADRRRLLKVGAGAAALVLAAPGRWLYPAAAQEAATAQPQDVCILTPEMTEGPYYVPDPLLRRDITEGKPGLPLRLRIGVVEVSGQSCAPLANAAVDIWHCDAQGYYSGVSSNTPGPDANPDLAAQAATQDFLRGVQLTDANGIAEFDTIYPGWYIGRTIHIHAKVHVGGDASGDQYESGHVAHTGQIFFDDATSDDVFATHEAYAGRPNEMRTRNTDDGILGRNLDEPGFILTLTPLAADSPDSGFSGAITFGVDPNATPDPSGFGGPPPG